MADSPEPTTWPPGDLFPVTIAGTGANIEVGAWPTNGGGRVLVFIRSPLQPVVRAEFQVTMETPSDLKVPGSRGYPPEHWQRVADLYKEAVKTTPRNPVVTVARQVGRSEAAVSRWIRTVRKMGLLGPD